MPTAGTAQDGVFQWLSMEIETEYESQFCIANIPSSESIGNEIQMTMVPLFAQSYQSFNQHFIDQRMFPNFPQYLSSEGWEDAGFEGQYQEKGHRVNRVNKTRDKLIFFTIQIRLRD